MSLNSKDFIERCEKILLSPKHKHIVVLCEGKNEIWDTNSRETVVNYGKMEQMPDANFYKKCVPKTWRNNLPQFFNCGSRQNVIEIYFKLLELCDEYDENDRYLKQKNLFAIVDLDIQSQTIDNYNFSNTEEIFHSIYERGEVNEQNAEQHRIWVTGLIHKEAYFIIPEFQQKFDNHINPPIYNNQSLVLENIYFDMVKDIINDSDEDKDLKSNLLTVSNRIIHCSGLNSTDLESLRDSWIEQFHNAENEVCKRELICALLTIRKAKDYWKQIQPPTYWTGTVQAFRDQLLLQIAKFYSEESNYAKYHIPYFMQILHQYKKGDAQPVVRIKFWERVTKV